METEDLREYLGIIVDLEKNIYMQKNLISVLKHKVSALCVPKEIQPPIPPVALSGGGGLACILLCPLCLLGSFIAAFILCIPVAVMDSILSEGSNGSAISDIIFFSMFIAFSLISCCSVISGFTGKKNEHKKKREEYEQSFAHYQELCFQNELRMKREQRQKEVILESIEQLEGQNKATVQSLSNMYALNIIAEEYRSFTRVCTLYEYIRSGRCHALEETKGYASGGAYNLLCQEEMQKKIILRLDQIIQRLDSIQSNQYMLYNAIQEGNQKLNIIASNVDQLSEQISRINISGASASKLDAILKNSELTAYSTERIEKELNYMNRMNYFAGKYAAAGILQKRPPV